MPQMLTPKITAVDPWIFLQGGGAMGALMRAKDWSQTPLGPVEAWPQSLRSTVSVMLTAPEVSYIFWGPELAILYNDLGRPIVGQKHPACVGLSIREVLKEAWSTIGPLVDGVMKSGTAVYLQNLLIPLERSGFVQDNYFTFSYIPVRVENGEVGGILVMPHETTAQVLGERRLALIREQSLRAALCQTVAQVLVETEEVLGQAPDILPFVLLYELECNSRRARCVVSAGIEPGDRACPRELDLKAGLGLAWPLDEVLENGEVLVEDLGTRFGLLPGGPSGEPAQRALLLPLVGDRAGEVSHVLVAGLNPRHLLDADAKGFFQLLARQIATTVASTRALEEKTQRAAQLAELDRQKTEFFSNVSHEFRTPLTLMLGPVEDALTHETALEGETLASVHRNALRLLKLVNTLLDFARVEAGRARAVFLPTNIAELTLDLASGFRSAVEMAGLGFEISCPPSSEFAFVDPDLWEKIVLNLLSNALKFTFEGKICVELAQDAEHVVLSVSDTGVGIPEHELPRLFERFHRIVGTRSRSHEGSGIGLALVADLSRLHGGSIAVRSQLGAGTTFTVTIPRGSAAPGAALDSPFAESTATGASAYTEEARRWLPARQTPGEALNAPLGQRGARVLVADDNADMRDYLTRLLRERWTVETATDGEQALLQATAHPPDAIVSDMMMPGLNGMELLRALRKDDRTREVPFIMLSARADQQATADALADGASDFMLKPFSARELLARVKTQLDVSAAQAAARRRLESFLLELPAAVAIFRGSSLTYVLANERYERLVGRSSLVGRTAREALPELTGQGVWNIVDRVYATGKPFVADTFAAQLSRGPNGALDEGFFNWVAQPTHALDGAVDGVMIFAVEVTEQVRARRKLEQASALEQALRAEAEAATARAEMANRAKDEFLAMLGHELRNPMAPISTALHLMQMRGDSDVEKERLVIERQMVHLEGLVSDLLDVSRIAQGKIELQRANVEISSLLSEAIEMASPLLERRRHHLRVEVPATGLIVQGDGGRLRQVFANLITNAAKYTEAHGRITIQAQLQEDLVVIRVSDSGAGISAEMLPRIFTLFSQAPQSLARSEGGLGLGLAIVRSIVEMHGGRVNAESEGLGKGSTFVVELPAASTSTSVVPREPRRASRPPPCLGASRGRVLIVDDNQDAAELLAQMLTLQGYVTEIAFDGPQALQLVPEFRPTVALLDIGLPVMDGFELARRLRSDPRHTELRLVAITGYGQREDLQRSKAAGFDAHLVKPVDLDRLLQVLDLDETTEGAPESAARAHHP